MPTQQPQISQTQHALIRKYYLSLPNKEIKDKYLASLNSDMRNYFWHHPDIFLFDKQIFPTTNWRYLMFRAGRRAGKTYSGAGWIAMKLLAGARRVGLCGATYSDVRDVMVENVLGWFPRNQARYIGGDKHQIVFDSGPCKGAIVYCYTADKETRGPTLEYLWCDEICNWNTDEEKVQVIFDSIDTAVSEGKHPQTLITSTPKPFKFFFDFQEQIDLNNQNYNIILSTMFDNPTLSKGYIEKELKKYGKDKMRLAQEVYGDLCYQNPSALFNQEWIDNNRIVAPNNEQQVQTIDLNHFWLLVRGNRRMGIEPSIFIQCIRIGVDPAVSNGKLSDKTGIVVIAKDMKGHCYVLEDKSGKYDVAIWGKLVCDTFLHYKKTFDDVRIIAEKNQGGDLVQHVIAGHNRKVIPYIDLIQASKGKLIRAEPTAQKYQNSKVHHIGYHKLLEREMTNFTGDPKNSPDRLDALVHAINSIKVLPKTVRNPPSNSRGRRVFNSL